MIHTEDADFLLLNCDVLDGLRSLPDESVHCVVTSPPYWGLRDYGTGLWDGGDPDCDHLGAPFRTKSKLNKNWGAGFSDVKNAEGREPMGQTCSKCGARRQDQQLGLEPTPEEYVARMVEVFREVRRVLRRDGTCWVNLGDSYAANRTYQVGQTVHGARGERGDVRYNDTASKVPEGLKPKDLVGIPWRVAFALQTDGWYLRSDIIWSKPNPMPESVTDRPTKAHEYVFLLTKSSRYFFDQEAVREPQHPDGRHKTLRDYGETNGAHGNHQGMNERERWSGTGRNIRSVWEIATQPFSAERDGLSDKTYRASLGCPRHGLRAALESWRRAADGEPQDRKSHRIDSSVARRAVGLLDGFAAMTSHSPACPASDPSQTLGSTRASKTPDPSPSADSPVAVESCADHTTHTQSSHAPLAGSSGSPRRADALTATPRSTGSRRTDDSSDGGGTASEGSRARTECSEPSHETPAPGGSAVLARSEKRGRKSRRCTCTAIVHDHFATYPEELVRRCILAGTSERGCCPECGTPWERQIMATAPDGRRAEMRNGKAYDENGEPLMGDNMFDHGVRGSWNSGGEVLSRETVGWRPGCGCKNLDDVELEFQPIPCTVLDPFLGSGTTTYVARKHGRRSIGIELNPAYCDLAARRMQQQSLFA